MSLIDPVTRVEIMRDLAGMPTRNLEVAWIRLMKALGWWAFAVIAAATLAWWSSLWWLIGGVAALVGFWLDLVVCRMVERELAERRAQRPMP